MLVLLGRHELTVGELCSVLQLPQSTVSRHLKVLADAEWVTSGGTAPAATTARTSRHTWRLEGSGRFCASRSAPRQPQIRTPGA